MATKKKALKKSKLRHAEYYDFQKIQDKLYAESMDGKMFTKLVEIITLPENIKLAYRNIKKNKGSKTAGTDGKTIQHLEKLSEEKLVVLVQRKFSWYVPQSVRRVEIPKDNGKTRPLGIPTIMDRLVQQCVLQVLEPICEAKFHDHSYGFRPNRSQQHAISQVHVYNDLKKKLMAEGIPEEEIAFIHDAKTEQKKKELFAKVRGGEVRILMGSTAKMGAGTNVQDRLIALHDLDCPWRPSDLQQRLGRIVRQGNQNPEVEIFRYVTEGTFDAYLYQLVESKQRFIAQIMTSKLPARAAEDVDETALSYAEIKALATGNPQIIEKCNLDMEVSKLNMLRASHLSQRYALEELVLRKYPAEIKELNERIAGYEQDSARLAEHPKPVEGIAPMVLNGVTYAERENAGKAIIQACTHMNGVETVPVGSYRGFDMVLSYDSKANEFHMTLKGSLSHAVVLGADAGGNVTRIDNVLEKIDERLESARSQLAHTSEQLENARTEMVAPFPKEAELAEKTRRLNELNVLLNLNEPDRVVMSEEPDEGGKPHPRTADRER